MVTLPLLDLLRAGLGGEAGRFALARSFGERADIVVLPIPGQRTWALTHPDDLQAVLSAPAIYRKGKDYRLLRDLMGAGLVTTEGEVWKRNRRLLQPPFSRAEVATLDGLVRTEVRRWLAGIAPGPIDLFTELHRLAIRVIGRRLLDADLSEQAPRICTLIDHCSSHVVGRTQALVDVDRWIRTPGARKAEAARDELRALLAANLGRGGVVEAHLAEGALPEHEVVDHLLNLFAAGFDTTGNALGWALHRLASEPDLQDRVVAGLRDARPETLRCLVSETVRAFPTVPGATREARTDHALGDVTVPAGTVLLLLYYGLHHRPDFWPEPERFDPWRFATEAAPAGFLPFGAGPHKCIGSNFATLELSITFEELLGRFALSLPEGARPVSPILGISLRPDHRPTVVLTPR